MSLRPSPTSRRFAALGGVASLALVAACGGGSGSGSTPKASGGPTGSKGGTLYYLSISDFGHLDPARNYVTDSSDFGRLLYRTLLTYDDKPGLAGTNVVPDMATDLGTPSNDAKTWTFHIKPNMKYEDGTTITTMDIKYGVERSFSSLLPEGPQYIPSMLVNDQNYTGPYTDKTKKGLDSIQTPDATTIVFTFKKPFADFRYAAALTTTAPVPQAKDTGVNFDNHVFSSGPYKIDSYQRGKTISLSRNPNWDPATDPAIKAYPDKIVGSLSVDEAALDQRLIADNGNDKNAIDFTALAPESIAQALSRPAVKARLTQGFDNAVTYTAMDVARKGPLQNLMVRQALEYAYPKADARTAGGGVNIGDFATDLLVPTLKAHQDLDEYATPNSNGDPAKAKALLTQAGYPNGITLSLGATSSPTGQKVASVVKDALAKSGIKINIITLDVSKYYDLIGQPAKQPDLVNYAWIPDWPTPGTVIPPLFSCASIVPQGNTNVANFCDKDFDAKIDMASAETDSTKSNVIWQELDKQLLDQAIVIPKLYTKTLNVHGSNVKNTEPSLPFAGQIDIANAAVQ